MTGDISMAVVPLSIPRPERPEWVKRIVWSYEPQFYGEFYSGPCTCIMFHWESIEEIVNQQVSDMGLLRYAYLTISEDKRPAWRQFPPVIAWQRVAEKALRNLADAQPDANCPECHGTGMYETDTNHARLTYETYDEIGIEDWNTVYSIDDIRPEIDKQYIQHVFTPDGVWHSEYFYKGPGGFSDWEQRVLRLLDSYPDHEVIVFVVNM